MKRRFLLFLSASLVWFSVSDVAVSQADPPKPRTELVEEMIDLLNKTDSSDTFFVALKLLEPLKTDAKMAIPAIMRNAERLGIFKSHLADKDETEMVESVLKTLQKL